MSSKIQHQVVKYNTSELTDPLVGIAGLCSPLMFVTPKSLKTHCKVDYLTVTPLLKNKSKKVNPYPIQVVRSAFLDLCGVVPKRSGHSRSSVSEQETIL